MARLLSVAQFFLAEGADIWSQSKYIHCFGGQGGTPLDAEDVPLSNVSTEGCEAVCESNPDCHGFTRLRSSRRRPTGDCYLRSSVKLDECQQDSSWETYTQVAPPSLTGNVAYHLFEGKYTGLANKDAGDFKGDAGFIFGTFAKYEKGNPEASMEHNIIEMSEINVTGWGEYEECNAPGAEGLFTCPADQSDYCCTTHNIPANHSSTQLPGLEVNKMSLGSEFGFGGFWFSFPAESEGVTWTQKTLRRIAGKCLGDAWRKDAGGCDSCNVSLDSCVAQCIKGALCVNGSTEKLQATWDRVFADPNECPDVPFPQESTLVV